MKNKPDLFVTLIIIYLALLTVCVAIYAILQLYVKEIDRGTATNLMIWSATLFPSIALLYTFNTWREQKGSDVLSKLAEEMFFNIANIFDINKKIMKEHREAILNKVFKKIDLNSIDIETDLTRKLDEEIKHVLHSGYLIFKYTKDEKIKEFMKELNNDYLIYSVIRQEIYVGMKTVEQTENSHKAIAINKDDKNEYLDHQDKMIELSIKLNESGSKLSEELLKHIFHKE